MEDQIQRKLTQIEEETGARILLAVESGSRAWGFPSPDSDWDVRFIYAMPVDFYLQVRDRRDVIERQDGLLDVSGWDVRKAINLLLKSNASAVEWLKSPMVYRETEAAGRLRDFANAASLGGLQRHYYYVMRSIWREHFTGDGDVNLKKYFYAIRPALALRFIRQHNTAPPMDLPSLLASTMLLDDRTEDLILQLVEQKASTREMGEHARIAQLDALVIAEIRAGEALMGKDPAVTEDQYVRADAVFRALIGAGK